VTRRDWRPFEEARRFARGLGLKSPGEWFEYRKSGQRPPDIPSAPNVVYKDAGWIGWRDWLGYIPPERPRRDWRPFEEARAYVHTLGLKSQTKWREYCKSGEKPDDIPASAAWVYRVNREETDKHNDTQADYDGGWRGTADWLGVVNQWNRPALLAFLEDLRPHLPHLQEKELYAIISQSGAMPGFRKAFDKEGIGNLIRDLKENEGRGIEEALGRTSDEELDDAALTDEVVIDTVPAEGAPPEAVIQATTPEPSTEPGEPSGLPELATAKGLRAVDDLAELHYGLDDETAEFLVSNRVAALWDAYINATDPPSRALVDEALAGEGGYYFETIRSRFRGEREAVQKIPVPAGWAFRPPGVGYDEPPTEPNLMQKRTAFEVLTKKRVGNWSGVGAGKTLAGILASRVAGCRHTVVITNKATLAGWQQEIYRAFPDSVVRIGNGPILGAHPEEYTYTLINYERFQLHTRGKLVRELIEAGADFAILDEVQLVKQRDKNASIRREAVAGLLEALQSQNPDFRVLGMSATPVINNLLEARKLLEVVMGRGFSDLDAQATTANALAVHRALMVYGFRYRPAYETEMEPERLVEVDGNHLLENLRASAATGVLGLEQALLPTKLEAMRAHVRPGTIVYTHYVDGMIGPIRRFLESLGYSVGLYTGEDKSGLEPFLSGRVDVLVGSKPVGTGLDGLQTVCDRIIEMSLP